MPAARAPAQDDDNAFDAGGRATLFGFEDTPVAARIIARSRAWRVGGAVRTFAVSAVIAPFVAVFPPHAVWLIGALAVGGFLARRRYVERYTLVSVEGKCPKCGTPLSVKSGRLKRPHPLPCEGCNHEPNLRIPDEVLARNTAL
ncbi:MAG: hypothetical protein R3304_09165 [Longimicrobiales bacterium]|nr:hypothetical protein [Longimicrobiales bacterium]